MTATTNRPTYRDSYDLVLVDRNGNEVRREDDYLSNVAAMSGAALMKRTPTQMVLCLRWRGADLVRATVAVPPRGMMTEAQVFHLQYAQHAAFRARRAAR